MASVITKDFIYEIGVEELPASYIQPALDQLAREAGEFFRESRLSFGSIQADGTPRRLALMVSKLEEKQEAWAEDVMGPSARAAFDAEGKPTQVALGFARGKGVELSALAVRNTPKGDYVFAHVERAGRFATDLLAEWLPQATRRLAFPKSMRWGQGGPLRFARPVQWLLALYGDKTVRFRLEHLESGNVTSGHRFLKPGPVKVKDAASYPGALEKARVMLRQADRRAAIEKLLKRDCEKAGLLPVEDAELVEICANLVEWPAGLLGRFDPAYLEVPEEVLICTLKEHQRYFAARDHSQRLAPSFFVVTNGGDRNLDGVRLGNERVLKARLEDAKFFFMEDRKAALADRLEELKKVVWLEGWGSLEEKSRRLESLAGWLAERLDPMQKGAAARAALLCKCDLVTNVVGEKEFTSLQGVMGGIYARLSGEREEAARAIGEHYRPRFAGDGIPVSRAGQIVALADKLDNLVGCFAAGLIPTGSQDPYALRRQAAGLVAILREQPQDAPLSEMISFAAGLHGPKALSQAATLLPAVGDFIRLRLEQALLDRGFGADLVAAVVSRRFDLVGEAFRRAEALTTLRQREDFEAVTQAFSRVTNILAKAPEAGAVDENLLKEEAERRLHRRFLALRPGVERLCQAGNFVEAFGQLGELCGPIDGYFQEVMVMAEDAALRSNRLSMLAQVASTLELIADFTKLVKK